jgi:hypothetical protein
MKKQDQHSIEMLLKQAMPSITSRAEPQRDLWPDMLKRLEARPIGIPWFDWALLVAVIVLFAFFPEAIPVLLYHL